MKKVNIKINIPILLITSLTMVGGSRAIAESTLLTFEEVREIGAGHSKYKNQITHPVISGTPEPDLATFQAEIGPILEESCYSCHGEKKQKGDFRLDTLDPDLTHGKDVDWWLEVVDVISNNEMPPEDDEDEDEEDEGEKEKTEMAGEDRGKVIDWLSSEIQLASKIRRSEGGHSSFRRMTRYEYSYALQDLLGLPFDFGKDLLPDSVSEDGFMNSSEMLQMSSSHYSTFFELNRAALNRATVRGERPEILYWGIPSDASAHLFVKPKGGEKKLTPKQRRQRGKSAGAYYKNLATGETEEARWSFRMAVHALTPTTIPPKVPEQSKLVTVLPESKHLVVDLGNRLPDEGTLRVRFRASRITDESGPPASIALHFGWQGNNNSRANVRISEHDLVIDAPPGKPQLYQWDIPLSEISPRNPTRKTVELGAAKMLNPSEYIQLRNTSLSKGTDIQFDYVEVSTPVYEQWPPASHTGIFIDSKHSEDESAYAREILSRFMPRAWRRAVTAAEIDQHLALFAKIRTESSDFQDAMIDILSTVLSSPKFLYLVQVDSEKQGVDELTDYELATRLSMFLWSSIPDDELLKLAAQGKLSSPKTLLRQTERMLSDPRSQRFSKQFVEQWLNLELLGFLDVEKELYPQFDENLKAAMLREPISFFQEVLDENNSVIDFLHSDYAMVNERLAKHYGLKDIYGNDFRRVKLDPDTMRGGLMTQAGLLAMNSDGKDSHPLKRGIWLLERLLNDPPPPPPPAVPEIDLTDPEILKMTLKERMEDHRNHPACNSCHQKIDPWGIAFENYDAVGSWRDEINGKPVDASSLLFNKQPLNGVDGLKRFLLVNRQDQFAHSMVHKLTTYALGRPLTFGDRAGIEEITSDLRNTEDRLGDLVSLIVTSDLFQTK